MNCMIVCRSNSLHSYLPNKPSKLGINSSPILLWEEGLRWKQYMMKKTEIKK